MPTEEDLKSKPDDEGAPPAALEDERPAADGGDRVKEPADLAEPSSDEEDGGVQAPTQLGSQRFVYAAYFAGGIAIAFLLSKALGYAWLRLSTYKPQIGEPHQEIVMPVAGLIGLFTAIYYYRDEKTRSARWSGPSVMRW